MKIVAGIDLGGTAVNYTFMDENGRFLIDGLFEHPSLSKSGPGTCLQQIADGFARALQHVGLEAGQIVAIGLDTPGPASAHGRLSTQGSTNFMHPEWAGFDIRHGVEVKLERPTCYLNDGNAAALWGHAAIFGMESRQTSVSSIIGTGNGGGVIVEGRVLKGRNGFGGELGHVLLPYQGLEIAKGITPRCNCGRTGDLESLCSLTAIEKNILPVFLARHPEHPLAHMNSHQAAKAVRNRADEGDALCRDVFRVQAHALGLFFDQMINVFDPDALILGGGAVETSEAFQAWFISEIRSVMPMQREEQQAIPIHIMPNGDTAGARGAAIEAMKASF